MCNTRGYYKIFIKLLVNVICVTEILEHQREALVAFFQGIHQIMERGTVRVVLLVLQKLCSCLSVCSEFSFRQTHKVQVLALLVSALGVFKARGGYWAI